MTEQAKDTSMGEENWVKGFVLASWLFVLFWLVLPANGSSPMLYNFLHPIFIWLAYIGAFILFLFIVSIAAGGKSPHAKKGFGLMVQGGLLFVPLLYLPLATKTNLGSDTMRNRSLPGVLSNITVAEENQVAPQENMDEPKDPKEKETNTNPVAKEKDQADEDSKIVETPKEYPPVDYEDASLINIWNNQKTYKEKRVEVVGMVYFDEKLPKGIFTCYRFIMTCCAADATPVGVMVEPESIGDLEKDAWVKVQGRVIYVKFKERTVPKIVDVIVEPTPQPDRPYLSR